MISDAVCVVPTGDKCGEGAVWHQAHAAIYWTDILRFLIHRYTPSDQCVRTWIFDEPVTAIALTAQDDVLAVVLGSRVIFWEPASDTRTDHGFDLPGWPKVRLNDARVDPRGSLWAGTMRNNVHADGTTGEAGGTDGILYRIDPDSKVSVHRRDVGISNTLVWGPGKDRFYFADTLANVVWAYDYDASNGTISNETPFLDKFERGIPDGSTVDTEGYLWNCRFSGGCIVRVAPDGKIDRVIEMPVTNVTTCTFGGAANKTLYVTTAAAGAPAHERLAGGLFSLESDIGGLEENRFLGKKP
jgi:sugar lactone lactonase YvrE